MTGQPIAALGWRPQVGFDDGIKRTVVWYSDNRDWWLRARGSGWTDYYEHQYGRRLAESTPA